MVCAHNGNRVADGGVCVGTHLKKRYNCVHVYNVCVYVRARSVKGRGEMVVHS